MMKRKITVILAVIAGFGLTAIIGADAMIRSAAKGRIYSDIASIPHRETGVVLGCSRQLADGRNNLFFIYRIAAAVQLFTAGKVEDLIVSGDNHVAGYDEATDMKRALVAAGVPEERVACDFAGFRTFDTIVRSKEVFGQTNITVVSQKFHNQRALFIARRKGMDAIGFNAQDVDAYNGFRTQFRELLARVKTVLDLYIFRTGPKFLGPKIEIRGASSM